MESVFNIIVYAELFKLLKSEKVYNEVCNELVEKKKEFQSIRQIMPVFVSQRTKNQKLLFPFAIFTGKFIR